MKTKINRIQLHNLDAKKAYEYARGALVNHPSNPSKLVYIYKRVKVGANGKGNGYAWAVGDRAMSPKKLSDEEQKVFLNNPEFAYKYAWKLNTRLCKEVEDNFFSIVNEHNLPRVLYYCKIFKIPVPECFHNFATMSAAGLSNSPDKIQKIRSRKSKRYIRDFERNKKITKSTLQLYLANGWLSESDSLKEVIGKFQ